MLTVNGFEKAAMGLSSSINKYFTVQSRELYAKYLRYSFSSWSGEIKPLISIISEKCLNSSSCQVLNDKKMPDQFLSAMAGQASQLLVLPKLYSAV